jgi:nitrogen regulatory protein PII 1
MKMIRAIIRPERERHVEQALESIGEYALTKYPVTGRGRQGSQAGLLNYAELAKIMLMLVVPDERVEPVIAAITRGAYTGFPGDGRIFVTPVEKSVRLRTGETRT